MSVVFNGGALRSKKYLPLWLCPIELIQAVADTRLFGDTKYEPGSWQKGDRHFFVDCLSHAIRHLYDAAMPGQDDGETFEQHLGHAATNIAFILWAWHRGKIERSDFFNVARIIKEADQPKPEAVTLTDQERATCVADAIKNNECAICFQPVTGHNLWCDACMSDPFSPVDPVATQSKWGELLKSLFRSKPRDGSDPAEPGLCTREIGHSGPCNGFPNSCRETK